MVSNGFKKIVIVCYDVMDFEIVVVCKFFKRFYEYGYVKVLGYFLIYKIFLLENVLIFLILWKLLKYLCL